MELYLYSSVFIIHTCSISFNYNGDHVHLLIRSINKVSQLNRCFRDYYFTTF